MRLPIPLSRPFTGEAEVEAVRRALTIGALAGDGRFCREAELKLRELLDVEHALLTTSCTHALELALMTLGIGPGDEVILPSFTFPSTANAVVRQGATPVFVDICEDTFNVDPEAVAAAVTRRTRCILPVHYAGYGCDMDTLRDIAARNALAVVEDAAHGIGARWRGRALGTLGDVGCLSFHATKNVTCGEGGAFLTQDSRLARKAEMLREKGTNRAAFLRGEVGAYTWVEPGSSFALSDVLAAILGVQLGRADEVNRKRVSIWDRYHAGTADLEREGLLRRPRVHPHASHNGHVFAVLVDRRDEVISGLADRGVGAAFHYLPLHTSPFMRGRAATGAPNLPVTDRVSRSLLRLPLAPDLTDDEVGHVLATLAEVLRTLARHGSSPPRSRSQASRLLARGLTRA